MAVKTLLSVSLVFWLLLFCSDCGLQGVKASPSSEAFEARLHALKSLHPKISVINETRENHKEDPRGLEIAELLYQGVTFTYGIPTNNTLIVIYLDGWVIEAIQGEITWLEGDGKYLLEGGPGTNYWILTFVTFEWVYGYTYDFVVVVSRLTRDNMAAGEAERIPVEQTFRFDDRELRVKAPPEVRQEISYNKM
ncbi:uncharacterized protein LOC111866772 [Cryptotermes secundus]|uniref:uncharacterized protein LOC111866772 n=1 Tax=Cryptotermes secundus TaxID=105785 RepID=UPI000CD7C346|nr:uncharacterized protein LOC111866772 [Cryptotermes secundus]